MPEAVICSAVRTPIGRAAKGSLVDVRPDDLLAHAIKEAVARVDGLDPNDIVDVMFNGLLTPEERERQAAAAGCDPAGCDPAGSDSAGNAELIAGALVPLSAVELPAQGETK